MARPHLTVDQQREMLIGIAYLDRVAKLASSLRESHGIDNFNLSDSNTADFALHFSVNVAMPTFVFIKLGIVIDEAVKALWINKFPGSPPRFDDQLKQLREAHAIDTASVKRLKTFRNLCAHDLSTDASWDDFDNHFDAVITFLVTILDLPKSEPSPS